MNPQRPIRMIPIALAALALAACAPTVQELDLSDMVVEHLPKKVALEYLTSLQPAGGSFKPAGGSLTQCLFGPDGVRQVRDGNTGSELRPYGSLFLVPRTLMGFCWKGNIWQGSGGPCGLRVVEVYPDEAHRLWCIVEARWDQQDHPDERNLRKIVTALLAVGVREPARGTRASGASRVDTRARGS
jgi:hypothetical protein